MLINASLVANKNAALVYWNVLIKKVDQRMRTASMYPEAVHVEVKVQFVTR
jgi:hypothetical protein